MSTAGGPGGNGLATPYQPSSSVQNSGYTEPRPGRRALPVTRSSLLPRRLVPLRTCSGHFNPARRRKREMISADKKDATYWDKRRKNNEAAKRSREKRRFNDLLLEGQLLALSEENAQLRAQVLNLQYHTSGNLEKSKAPCATSPVSVLASSLSLSPIPAHTPALFQARLWGTSGSSSAAVIGMRHQETAMHHSDANIPFLSPTRVYGGFNYLSHHNRITQHGSVPLSGPRVFSHGGVAAEADTDALRQVSSSDDIPISTDAHSKPLSYLPTFLPTLDTLHASTVSYPPQNWVVPHLSHTAVCSNLLPWRSSYLATPPVYPGLPLEGRPGLGVEEERLQKRTLQEPVQQRTLRTVSAKGALQSS
ncbi:uncharacterized protein [Leuresthes tenuis]|uniref:uncharacterized protein n=1 Tax=Leuresthes tenuis TaxID=355514 RepID=UPI003B50A05B